MAVQPTIEEERIVDGYIRRMNPFELFGFSIGGLEKVIAALSQNSVDKSFVPMLAKARLLVDEFNKLSGAKSPNYPDVVESLVSLLHSIDPNMLLGISVGGIQLAVAGLDTDPTDPQACEIHRLSKEFIAKLEVLKAR